MKWFQAWFQRHQGKLWLLSLALGGMLALNVAAVPRGAQPGFGQWEYKSIWFRTNAGENSTELQQKFTDALNREAVNGWEFVGRCGHTDGREWWIDYVVFRRPRW